MKISFAIGSLYLAALSAASSWSSEDREIFRVRDELIAHEGRVTFYEFLGTHQLATLDEITKAYRNKAKLLHPDKVRRKLFVTPPGGSGRKPKRPTNSEIKAAVKKAEKQAQRLTIVADVLRGVGRDRYDHFLNNGFPVWKGTEYYYSRYRPGFGTALCGVFLLAGGLVHYLAMYLSWLRQRQFIERYINFAREAATSRRTGIEIPGVEDSSDEEMVPYTINRRERRMRGRETRKEASGSASKRPARGRRGASAHDTATNAAASAEDGAGGPQGTKKRVVDPNGKLLIVDSARNVFLEEEDVSTGRKKAILLDPNELPRPRVVDTAVFKIPLFLFSQSFGRLVPSRIRANTARGFRSGKKPGQQTQPASPKSSSSDGHQSTPSTGSAEDEDYELLEKSVDDIGEPRTTGRDAKSRTGGRRSRRKH